MRETETEPAHAVPRLQDTGATLLTVGGLAAAFGVASCCGLPLLLASLGIGSVWLGGIALLAAPHRGLLLTAAALCLGGAAVLLWRRRPAAACAVDAICSRPAVRGVTMLALGLGAALLAIGYLYA